jgi:ankyrin repeat protein
MPKCANPDCKTVDAEKEPNLRCGRCKHPSYCSKDCQRIHWPTHKPICNVLQSNPNALLAAAQTKNLHEIKILVSGGADVNYLYEEGATALFVAISQNHLPIVRYLLAHKASPDGSPNGCRRQTPLGAAVILLGDIDFVTVLIDSGAQVDKTVNGETPLCQGRP